jgi:hypothetical protein
VQVFQSTFIPGGDNGEKDVEFYIPERADKKETYKREIRKYSIYMILLVILGIGFFYLVTTAT